MRQRNGAEIAIARVAPMGDPIEIRVRGFSLSLLLMYLTLMFTANIGGCSKAGQCGRV